MNEELWILSKSVSRQAARKHGVASGDVAERLLQTIREAEDDFHWLEDPTIPGDEHKAYLQEFAGVLQAISGRIARELKATKGGYRAEDEAFYSMEYLVELLEQYFQTGVTTSPPVSSHEAVRQEKVDGSHYGNHLAAMVDVKRGLLSLPMEYREILWLRYGPLGHLTPRGIAQLVADSRLTGVSPEALTAVLGADADEVGARCQEALTALQAALGGPSPWARVRWPSRGGYAPEVPEGTEGLANALGAVE